MPEEYFNRLSLWQATAATITEDLLRHVEALEQFGEDENLLVSWPGVVNYIDRANAMTFDEYLGHDNSWRYYQQRAIALRQRVASLRAIPH